MTKSFRHHDADSNSRDFGVPEKTTKPEDWKNHTSEWEGWSDEEKQRWIDAKEKEEEILLDDTTK